MKTTVTALSLALFLTSTLAARLVAVPSLQTAPPATPPAKAGKSAAGPDWPDAKTLAKQKEDAESRRLFGSTKPLEFTLVANFKAINNDRAPSVKTYPATIQFAKDDGSPVSIELQLRTRGHVRRMYQTCEFAPLRLEFTKAHVKGTVFDDQRVLKLGTHCRNVTEFEQYVLREYAAYQISNLLTARSFRARLARATYVDAATKKSLGTRHAMFIEDDDDVAKRLEGRITEEKDSLRFLDRDAFTLMTVFEYLIGNVDMSIIAQHNVKLVQTPARVVYPVPYDFDYSGLVNAAYALPPPTIKIGSVRERAYRGPCRTAQELEGFFAPIRKVRPDITAIYDSLPDLDARYKRNALGYLDQFFKLIDRPSDVKAAFLENCLKKGIM